MPQRFEHALVLSDGGLESLIAASMVAEASRIAGEGGGAAQPGAVLCAPPRGSLEVQRRLRGRAASLHAEAFGLADLGAVPDDAGDDISPDLAGGQRETSQLVRAAYVALAAGCRRVIWPVRARWDDAAEGPDLEAVSCAIDKALLVGRLVSIDLRSNSEAGSGGTPEVRIETPFVDMTAVHVGMVARDMGLGPALCWWGIDGAAGEIGVDEERARWGPHFEAFAQPA